jgi:hypothetical protein
MYCTRLSLVTTQMAAIFLSQLLHLFVISIQWSELKQRSEK